MREEDSPRLDWKGVGVPLADSALVSSSTRRKNYRLAVANGVLNELAMSISDPGLVLPVFVRLLGGSNTLVGAFAAIRFGGWFLPQFPIAGWMQPRRRKVPIAIALDIMSALTYGVIGALTYAWGLSAPGLLLGVVVLLFAVSRVTAGTGKLARTDTLGKIVPARQRARFFATSNLWGGAAVFGAGFLIRYMLDEDAGWPFPANFTLLFSLSALCYLAAVLLFAQVKEPPGPANQPRHPLKEQLSRAPGLLRADSTFRRYMLVRLLLFATRMTAPFYPILALDKLGAPPSMVGIYASAMTASRVLTNLLWQRIGGRRSSTYLLQASTLLSVLEPILALVLPWLMQVTGLLGDNGGLLPAYLFGFVFLVSGCAMSGRTIGMMSLMLDVAPDTERASYIGLVNTALGFTSLLPILAGAAIDRLGFEPVFITAAVSCLGAYLVSLGFEETVQTRLRPST